MHCVLLRTRRLILRRFAPADIDSLVELDADPEVMRFINGGRPTPRTEFERSILPRWLALYDQAPAHGFWAAEDEPGRFLGWFHLKPAHHWPGELELGYRLRREFWGQGLATEGAIALIDLCLNTLQRDAVVAATMLANVGSRRVMEKAGMHPAGEFTETRWPGPDKRALKYIARSGAWNPPNHPDGRAAGASPSTPGL